MSSRRKPNCKCSKCNKSYFTKNLLQKQFICKSCDNVKYLKNCLNCQTPTYNPKFCSKTCSAQVTNKLYPKRIRKTICTRCKTITKSYRHTLCDLHHKEYMNNKFEVLKELTLQDYWSKDSLKNLHPSSKNAHIRAQARSNFKDLISKPCHNCGYDKHVELCHIKPIRDFLPTSKIKEVNSYDNLIQLCPNCHWEFDNGLITL